MVAPNNGALRPKWLVVTVRSVSALSWMRRHRSRNFLLAAAIIAAGVKRRSYGLAMLVKRDR